VVTSDAIQNLLNRAAEFVTWLTAQLGSALPVLLGGAGGVLVVWWLDGRRLRRRERQSLIGAIELVGTEISSNVTQAHMWAEIPNQPLDYTAPGAPPIQMKSVMWEANANELARMLPRDLVGMLSVAHYNTEMFSLNVQAAQRRGEVTEGDIRMAAHTRNLCHAVLLKLQEYEREHLGVAFSTAPPTSTDAMDSPWGSRVDSFKNESPIQVTRAAWQQGKVPCRDCGKRLDPVRDLHDFVYEPGAVQPREALVQHERCGARLRLVYTDVTNTSAG
jgi:hypothetical protein